MKVLLIMPYNCDLIHAVSLPMGLISIGTYLKAHGHEVKICDLAVTHCNIEKIAREFNPAVIGISLSSSKSIDGAIHISKRLKKLGVPIVWGGSFCDVSLHEHILETGFVDCISFSEGEETWLNLTQVIGQGGSLETVNGIAFLKDGKPYKTPEREFIDLGLLPQLDYSLVDVNAYGQYLYGCKKLVYVYLSKGCPAHCTFCTNQLSHRCKYRRRPLEQFMAETRVLCEQYGVDGLYFSDELCFYSKEQLYEVCDAFDKSGLNFTWGFQTRIGILGEPEFKRLYESGCRWIDFGIESGNKEQLKLMKKGIPYDKIEPTFEWCSKYNIISLANFIVGLPGETEEQLMDSVMLASRIKATQCSFFQYCLSPKTEMGKAVLKERNMDFSVKKLTDYKKIDFFISKIANVSFVPKKDLEVVQSYFLWHAIFRKNYGEKTHVYDLFFKHILTLFRRLSFLNFRCAVTCLFELVYLFARFFCDTHFHPKILRKYKLK